MAGAHRPVSANGVDPIADYQRSGVGARKVLSPILGGLWNNRLVPFFPNRLAGSCVQGNGVLVFVLPGFAIHGEQH